MDPIEIPQINLRGTYNINGQIVTIPDIRQVDNRMWIQETPQSIPITVPITIQVGTPVIEMPGCVKVHKENARERNINKQLVNDDPKQNVVLCDGGMPYYEPPDYRSDGLEWQTVYGEPEEIEEGVPIEEPIPPQPEVEPPETPTGGNKEVECPPLNARRIGDRSQKGDEQVKEYKLTPDGLFCETIWEPVPVTEQFLPSVGVVSTTAVIATVATASALFAKPLADLLLKVIKPLVKKVIDSGKKKLGGSVYHPSVSEVKTNLYRKSKGLPEIDYQKMRKKKKDPPI